MKVSYLFLLLLAANAYLNKFDKLNIIMIISFFFKALILNLLQNKNQNIQSSLGALSTPAPAIEQQNSLIINQYQQIIRDQDAKLKENQQEKQTLIQTCTQLQEYCQSLHASLAAKDEFMRERLHEFDSFSSEKLKLNAKINELEVKNNLLKEKYYYYYYYYSDY